VSIGVAYIAGSRVEGGESHGDTVLAIGSDVAMNLEIGMSRTEVTEGFLFIGRSRQAAIQAVGRTLHLSKDRLQSTHPYIVTRSDPPMDQTSVPSVRAFPILGSQQHPSRLPTVSSVSPVSSVRFFIPAAKRHSRCCRCCTANECNTKSSDRL
jgi:hypothetical protein